MKPNDNDEKEPESQRTGAMVACNSFDDFVNNFDSFIDDLFECQVQDESGTMVITMIIR